MRSIRQQLLGVVLGICVLAAAVLGFAAPAVAGVSTAAVSTAAASSSAVSSPPGPAVSPGVPAMGTAQPGTTVTPVPAPDASEPFPWSLVIFAAVAVGLLVAIGVLARRRPIPDDEEETGQP